MSEKNKIESWAEFLEEQGVEEVVEYDLREVSDVVDRVILGSAKNGRHMSHVSEEAMRWAKTKGFGLLAADGLDGREWVVLDFGHYMVHLILPETRYRIDLEGFWQEQFAKKKKAQELDA